jgi:hypothetical protein
MIKTFTDEAGISVKLQTCNREVLGSNLGWNIAYIYNENVHDFLQSLREDDMMIPPLGHGPSNLSFMNNHANRRYMV